MLRSFVGITWRDYWRNRNMLEEKLVVAICEIIYIVIHKTSVEQVGENQGCET